MISSRSAIRRALQELAGPVVLIALVVWILHRALFSGGALVPGGPVTDVFSEYIPWRYFGFSQWRDGHFPFWNPHVFCGNPFFGQIQSCLLYPITWVNFVLNTAGTVTLEMSLDLSAGAICLYAWARARGISRCGSTLAGAVFAFSGAFYPYVFDGYLSVLASAAWMPLVFLALDRLLAERFGSGILVGAIAVCLQCLGGQAQLVYYTFLIGGLYVLLESIGRRRVLRIYAAFVGLWLLGGMLAAVQLLPSYFATQLSIRAGGVSYDYASMVSLPPENLLTIFIPYPLGNAATVPYMGRWYLWETSLYIGIVALVLACIGIARMEQRGRWRMMILLGTILLLALGAYTPLLWICYKCLPAFKLFRGPSKFRIVWALLLAVLAGHGWDHLQHENIPRWTMRITAIAAVVCALLSAIAYQFNSSNGPVGELLRFIFRTGKFDANVKIFYGPGLPPLMSQWMAWQWGIAAALLATTSILIYLRRHSITAGYLLFLLAVADTCLAAANSNVVSAPQPPFPEQWTNALTTATQHDQRVLFAQGLAFTNQGNLRGYDTVWGYDTGQPTRLTQLIAASQGQHPAHPDQYDFVFEHTSRIFEMLRCRYIFQWSDKYPVLETRDPMPHLQLIGNYVRMNDPAAIADRLVRDFDFRHSVILETIPNPAPAPLAAAGATGHATLLRQSINDLEIEADVPAPVLLLITDAYAPGWHVRPMEINNHQATYEVLQADDVLRAIPLAVGHHHFDLYYIPPGLEAGAAISGFGLIALIVGAMRLFRVNRQTMPVISR